MRISIVGSGYVGLVSGAGLAEVGHHVLCMDIDAQRVERLARGEVPIYEPGLEELLLENMEQGRLAYTTSIAEAVEHAEVLMVAVGTPPEEDGSADLSHVLAVAGDVGAVMEQPLLIVVKSTVPVGTCARVRETVQKALDRRGVELGFSVASNPEFLAEGAAIANFMKPDRIVVGVEDENAEQTLRELYAPFNRNHEKLMCMDIRSAELTKYAANAMLATKISFMNELANIAERVGADIEKVRLGIGSDPRIGYHFIYPGAGYGGSCFPKDVKALVKTMTDHAVDASILEAVESVNETQKTTLLRRVVERLGEDLTGRTVAVWGLAFKPNTDDMREAPSLVTIEGLLERGARVVAHDPVAMDEARHHLGDRIGYADGNYDALQGADALVIHTEWHPYRHPDFARMREAMARPLIVDGRNLYEPEVVAGEGFEYLSIGRRAAGTVRVVRAAPVGD